MDGAAGDLEEKESFGVMETPDYGSEEPKGEASWQEIRSTE
jgi:hypothetical protein